MMTFLIVLHVILAVALVLIILIQEGDDSGLGGSFGGSSSDSFFSASGGQDFIKKTTAVIATLLILVSLVIAKINVEQRKQMPGLRQVELQQGETNDSQVPGTDDGATDSQEIAE